MPKNIKTPEQVRLNIMQRVVRKFQRERALKEKVRHLERVNAILKKRLDRERKGGIF